MLDYKKFLKEKRREIRFLLPFLYQDKKAVFEYWTNLGEHQMSDAEFNEWISYKLYNHNWRVHLETIIQEGQIRDGERILDVGCGWGRILIGLRKYLPHAELVGIEIIEKLIERAKKAIIREIGSLDRIDLLVGDADDLPFKNQSFDRVIAIRVLQYLPSPARTLKEFKRVLKDGGTVVIAVPNKLNPVHFFRYHTKLYSPGEVKSWLQKAGFSQVKIKPIRFVPYAEHFSYNSKIEILESLAQKIPLLKWIGGLIIGSGKKT